MSDLQTVDSEKGVKKRQGNLKRRIQRSTAYVRSVVETDNGWAKVERRTEQE
jgi:uncharacterized membrane-anchored protein